MVKGLENDEIEFLETVSRQREQEELEKDLEERILLAEYKVCSASFVLRLQFRVFCSVPSLPRLLFRAFTSASFVPRLQFRLFCSAPSVPRLLFRVFSSASFVPRLQFLAFY